MGDWWSQRTRTHEQDDQYYKNRVRKSRVRYYESRVRRDSSKEITLAEDFNTVVRHGDTTVEFKSSGDVILRAEGPGNVDVYAETVDRIHAHALRKPS